MNRTHATDSDPMARLSGDRQQHAADAAADTLFAASPPPSPPPATGLGSHPLPPFARDSETSRQAAIDHHYTAAAHITMILEYVKSQGDRGATADESTVFLASQQGYEFGATHVSASARFSQLKTRGYLVDTGRKRPTRAGHPAAVLKWSGKPGDGRPDRKRKGDEPHPN